jgi:hypothetical protein
MIIDRTVKYHIGAGRVIQENLEEEVSSEREEELYFLREQNCPCCETSD